MEITEVPAPHHERVVRVSDDKSGLIAFIAIHSTSLGPAAGGLRMRQYQTEDDAITDVLRLSEGMTFKNAAASLPLGGGKAVIIGDPQRKTREMLHTIARAINSFEGTYWTAEDMGMTPTDMATIAEETAFVAGLVNGSHASGDPSPHTADGIFRSICNAVRHKYGDAHVKGRHVAVQGLGNVGANLCRMLSDAGATLTVADMDADRVARMTELYGATAADPSSIHKTKADIFSPCAIGGILNPTSIPELHVPLVVGGANNQLSTPSDAEDLHRRGILYAPDYIVNAGGIINVATEILQIENPAPWVEARLQQVQVTLAEVFEKAKSDDVSPAIVATALVEDRLRRKSTV